MAGNSIRERILLAVMAGMYAVWHGPEGLARIARRWLQVVLVAVLFVVYFVLEPLQDLLGIG